MVTARRKMMKIQWKDVRKNVNYITNAAFGDIPNYKYTIPDGYKPTFTMKDHDNNGLISMERLYVEHYADPTEYTFVQDVFDGDLKHWEAFKNATRIRDLYKGWKKKAEQKLLSEAMQEVVRTAFDPSNKSSFQALKFLVDRGTKMEEPKRGRPKKEKEPEEESNKELLEDIKRLKEGL